MYVVQHNTLVVSFQIRIVSFQPKQESNRIQISCFKNRIGSDSKNPLSDHLWGVLPWECGGWGDCGSLGLNESVKRRGIKQVGVRGWGS